MSECQKGIGIGTRTLGIIQTIPYHTYHTGHSPLSPNPPCSRLFGFISLPPPKHACSLSFPSFAFSFFFVLTLIHSFIPLPSPSHPRGLISTYNFLSLFISIHCLIYGGLSSFAFPCSRPLTCSSHAAFRPSFRSRISFLVNSSPLILFSSPRSHHDDLYRSRNRVVSRERSSP